MIGLALWPGEPVCFADSDADTLPLGRSVVSDMSLGDDFVRRRLKASEELSVYHLQEISLCYLSLYFWPQTNEASRYDSFNRGERATFIGFGLRDEFHLAPPVWEALTLEISYPDLGNWRISDIQNGKLQVRLHLNWAYRTGMYSGAFRDLSSGLVGANGPDRSEYELVDLNGQDYSDRAEDYLMQHVECLRQFLSNGLMNGNCSRNRTQSPIRDYTDYRSKCATASRVLREFEVE